MTTKNQRDTITLFLTEARAEAAGVQRKHGHAYWKGHKGWTHRVLSATLRDHDGTVDHGFKVLMVPPRGKGTPYYL